jgi:hypothetical protein
VGAIVGVTVGSKVGETVAVGIAVAITGKGVAVESGPAQPIVIIKIINTNINRVFVILHKILFDWLVHDLKQWLLSRHSFT